MQCAHATMETLTLARFICELTLQEYDFVQERASQLAASCLLLALRMKDLKGWVSRGVRIASPASFRYASVSTVCARN